MEGKICIYNKFGFCKYKERCRNQHCQETCEQLSGCKSIKICSKRHPKVCRRFASAKGCRFENDECAYHHPQQSKSAVNTDLNVKVEAMEIVINKMVLKIFNLETELNKIKSTTKTPEMSTKEAVKTIEQYEEENNSKKYETLHVDSEPNSARQLDKPKREKPIIEMLFNCDQCDYKCKKGTTLNKHMHTKHIEQHCKRCKETFKTAIDLVMHVAKEHSSHATMELREQTEGNTTPVIQSDKTEELPDNTKCVVCREKFQESNTLNIHEGKCTLCSILSYGDE